METRDALTTRSLAYCLGQTRLGYTGTPVPPPASKCCQNCSNSWTCSTGDTSTGCTSTTLASAPENLYAASAVASGSTIYVFSASGNTWAYNVTFNTWTQKASSPTPTEFSGAVLAKGLASNATGIIIQGGCCALATNEEYFPATNRWMQLAPLPTAVVGPAMAVTTNGLVMTAGGGYSSPDGYNDSTNGNQLYAS